MGKQTDAEWTQRVSGWVDSMCHEEIDVFVLADLARIRKGEEEPETG